MKHVSEHIETLIQKSLEGKITEDEKKILDEWYYHFSPEELSFLSGEAENEIGKRVQSRLNDYVFYEKSLTRHQKKSGLLKALVAVSFSITAVLYYFLSQPKQEKKTIVAGEIAKPVKDIAPGSNKAILTLGDGSTIMLDSSSNGQLCMQGNAKVIKLNNGQLQYLKNKKEDQHAVIYNSIVTPRGGQYQVVLADGSKAWLNASSSLRFPTEFRDSVRDVEITGEAYFEVAHNASKPFRVKVKDVYVNVIGTNFDVMAYDNENTINTTLLEGSLNVSKAGANKLLRAGQQAILDKQGFFRVMPDVDIEEVMAWKNGKFMFNSADIQSIMRQVERWYNVDVVFEQKGDLHFTGQLGRYENVSQLLKKLELTNEVHFRIEKGKITVLP